VVDLLVEGARSGWTDQQLRGMLGRLVPEFRDEDLEVELDVEIAPA
jgi:hypothetical protein